MNFRPQDLLDSLAPSTQATIVALQGELGAGKTTFTQEVGKLLGVTENMHSPTFVIMKVYEINYKPARQSGGGGFKHLIHIDAYRLENDAELLHLGWEEIIKEPENLVFIEWPENVAGIIPENAKRISFKHVDDATRAINYES